MTDLYTTAHDGSGAKEHSLKYHNKRVAVRKEFTFDAAHRLDCYDGKCRHLHGHTYRLIISVSGRVNDIGLCIDFEELKSMYKDVVETQLDHRFLNDALPPMNTTAENMVVWIWEQLDAALETRGFKKAGHRLEEITLFETPTSSATIRREWMDGGE